MYAKCGQIEKLLVCLEALVIWNIGDWNFMIFGLALYGLGREAIEGFLELERVKLKPDDITFLGLLIACNHDHGGLVEEGQFYFETMQVKYKIVPKIQHYGCIIDLLGRAGHLEEALGIIHDMPLEPDVLIWKNILGACLKRNNFVMGHAAALREL